MTHILRMTTRSPFFAQRWVQAWLAAALFFVTIASASADIIWSDLGTTLALIEVFCYVGAAPSPNTSLLLTGIAGALVQLALGLTLAILARASSAYLGARARIRATVNCISPRDAYTVSRPNAATCIPSSGGAGMPR